eukprot:m.96455 g.96455  ORF g.96455 m.96455 type:complete len:56 (+) comp10165_c0_seq1:956-1123(+)
MQGGVNKRPNITHHTINQPILDVSTVIEQRTLRAMTRAHANTAPTLLLLSRCYCG